MSTDSYHHRNPTSRRRTVCAGDYSYRWVSGGSDVASPLGGLTSHIGWTMRREGLNEQSRERALRTRLVQISDELAVLAPDAFAAKHELNLEADEARRALSELTGDESAALDAWAERAARKGIPKTDAELHAEAVAQTKGAVGSAGS